MLLMRGNSSKYAYPAYWNFCVNKHFGTLFRTTGLSRYTLLVDLAPRRYHQPSCQIFLTLNCHLDIHKISSIKNLNFLMFKTPRLVSMYCTGSSPRFWIWLTFSNLLVLSTSLISYFLVFVFQLFWFECCWWEVTPRNMHIQHIEISALTNTLVHYLEPLGRYTCWWT